MQEVLLSGDHGEEILQMEMTENSYFTPVAIILENIKRRLFLWRLFLGSVQPCLRNKILYGAFPEKIFLKYFLFSE